MGERCNRWRSTNRRVLSFLHSSEEENCSENADTTSINSLRGSLSESSLGMNTDTMSDSSLSEGASNIGTSSSSDFSSDIDYVSLSTKLAACAIQHRWTRESVNHLLSILNEEGLHLPKDARTLLRTPANVPVTQKCGGEYVYLGIENSLKQIIASSNYCKDEIQLKFNIDGLPLFDSSPKQFWPILGSFENYDIFIVSLFYGLTKPTSVFEFLEDFLVELNSLMENGMHCNQKFFQVSLKCFLCDAPARSFLKGIICHTGYNSCERCLIHGSWEGRVVFNENGIFPSRNENSYQHFEYQGHQQSLSPLLEAGLNIIHTFPLDYMHLVCLGAVRKILNYLKKGPCGKISACQIKEISLLLQSYNGSLPSEFARQPRSLHEIDRWKATELRQFLLYTGPVVLRNIVSTECYHHFLALSISMTILLHSDDNLRAEYINYAKELLQAFVSNAKYIYGLTFTSYNIHNLMHIADDCLFFGCSLNDLSCFPFENFLQQVKKRVRNSNSPIVQVCKRQIEFQTVFNSMPRKKILTKLSTSRKDHCFLTKNASVAFIKSKFEDGSFVCHVYKKKYFINVYDHPMPSKNLNIMLLPKTNLRKYSRKTLDFHDVLTKCVCLEEHRGLSIFPVLHDLQKMNNPRR